MIFKNSNMNQDLENEILDLKKEIKGLIKEKMKMIKFIQDINKENKDVNDDNFRIIINNEVKSIDNTKVLIDPGLGFCFDCNGYTTGITRSSPTYMSILELLQDENMIVKIEKRQKYIYDPKKEVISFNDIREKVKEKLGDGYSYDRHIDFINRCEKDKDFDISNLEYYYENLDTIEANKSVDHSEIEKMNDLLIKYKEE